MTDLEVEEGVDEPLVEVGHAHVGQLVLARALGGGGAVQPPHLTRAPLPDLSPHLK